MALLIMCPTRTTHEVVLGPALNEQHPTVVDERVLPRAILAPDLPPELPGRLARPKDLTRPVVVSRKPLQLRRAEEIVLHDRFPKLLKERLTGFVQLRYRLLYFLQAPESPGPRKEVLPTHVSVID